MPLRHLSRIALAGLLSGAPFATRASAEIVRHATPAPAQKPGDWTDLKIVRDRPESEGATAGTRLGNNFTGVLLKGGVETEIIQLNDKTFWSAGPVNDRDPRRKFALADSRKKLAAGDIPGGDAAARGMWGPGGNACTGTFLPLGTLYLKFNHGGKAAGYSRTLDLDSATATVRYDIDGVTYTRETFASHPDRVVVMRLRANKPGKISFATDFRHPKEMEGHDTAVTAKGDTLTLKGRAPSYDMKYCEPAGMTFESQLKIKPTGGTVRADNNRLRVDGADEVVLLLSSATSYAGPDKDPGTHGVDPHPIVDGALARAAAKSHERLLADHLRDYRALFRRCRLDIDGKEGRDHILALQYARYDMIATSRGGDRPRNQQGMWCSDWYPPNQSSHFLNENVQKYYGLIETANLADCGEPLWNWMDELAQSGALTAMIDWGFRGWLAPHSSDIWATTALKGGDNEFSIWPMGGVWLCNNLWDHYAFSGDMKFLRSRAYPLMKGAALFCLDYLVDDGQGGLVTSPSTSPENKFELPGGKAYAVSRGATMDIALIRELFQNCVRASDLLATDAEFRRTLRTALEKLPPYRINTAGELREWAEDFKKHYRGHRHASHLITVWPLSQITERDTPELFKAAKVALEDRGGGGYHPDKMAMWARLKEGDRAVKSLTANGHALGDRWSVLAAAIPEMLLFSHTRDAKGAYELELLPALPAAWPTGKVDGLRARGGYEIAVEWKDGKLVRARIDSALGTLPTVRYDSGILDLKSDPRVTVNLR